MHADCISQGMVFSGVRLSRFPHNISKNRYSWDHQTWRGNVPPWVLEIHLFSVKDQRNEEQKTVPAWVFALLW